MPSLVMPKLPDTELSWLCESLMAAENELPEPTVNWPRDRHGEALAPSLLVSLVPSKSAKE
jgi:hypothetical protein